MVNYVVLLLFPDRFGHIASSLLLLSGDLFLHGHLTRAVCCRVQDSLSEQFSRLHLTSYQLHHPFVGRVALYRYETFEDLFPYDSINWSAGDAITEIVTAVTGKATLTYEAYMYIILLAVIVEILIHV